MSYEDETEKINFKTKAVQEVGTHYIALCNQGQRTEDTVLVLLWQAFQKSC